jgi:thimet oligopeptidase
MVYRFVILMALVVVGCAQQEKVPEGALPRKTAGSASVTSPALIRYEYEKDEITKLCDGAINEAKARLDVVAGLPASERNFESSMMEFESALSDFSDTATPLVFMGYVSQSEFLRKEAEACEKKVGEFTVNVFTRKDLYDSLKDLKGANGGQTRLLSETLESFVKNGLKLPPEKLTKMRELKTELSRLETEFSANLNNDTTSVFFTLDELAGVPDSTVSRFKKTPDGLFIATTKSTDYTQVMQNASKPETRKKMLAAYQNRALANTPLLEKALDIRSQIAKLMGYQNWAQYRINGRMAKNDKEVFKFLGGLKTKLAVRNKADTEKLLKFKRETDKNATSVDIWDLTYLSYQLKKRDFTLDDEKIREYFPSDFVMNGVFDVYSELLGVRFEKVEGASVWANGVSQYRVIDKKTNQLVAYFFTDLAPREGKYGHAAAFSLILGRWTKANKYSVPVSSIVANFNPPAGGKPSLLNHDEVETLFHEFGHIMHQTLTRAPYASLSGTSVRQDFVEAPSQMLENWVWDSNILNRLSGHYKNTSDKLPPEILKQLLAAKDFNQGYFYTRQLFLGLFDMTIHTAKGPVDTAKVHDSLYSQILGIKPLVGGRFAAGFGHMMGGYDAGYYGYLWSEVYAQDMFTRFENGKILDPTIGERYRRTILERGNMVEPLQLITAFLERAPNNQAFFKKLGIK